MPSHRDCRYREQLLPRLRAARAPPLLFCLITAEAVTEIDPLDQRGVRHVPSHPQGYNDGETVGTNVSREVTIGSVLQLRSFFVSSTEDPAPATQCALLRPWVLLRL